MILSVRQVVQWCAVCGLRPIPKWHVAALVPHGINTLNILSLHATSPDQLVSSGSRLKTVRTAGLMFFFSVQKLLEFC